MLHDILPEIIEFRHQLHRIPEMAGEEYKTSELIRKRLGALDLEVLPPFLGTDVVALLHGGKGPGKNVTLRADIDALFVNETTGAPYCSEHPGRMHGCGHDGHTAIVMGAAELLVKRRHEFAGSIRFVFQPGEENRAMGRDLVEAGALENPKADLVTALHGQPGLPLGVFGVRDGAIMGSCAHFKVTLLGRGGHSSVPFRSRNPVTAAAALICELESVAARLVKPHSPAVLTVCRVNGGIQSNVIPDTATIAGTARSLSDESDKVLEAGLRRAVSAIAEAREITAEIEYRPAYPVTYNWPEATDFARNVLRSIDAEFRELPEPSMGAEDFSYYLKRYPGVYVKLGTGVDSPALHNSRFDFPDALLEPGIEYFTAFALAALQA